MGEGDGSMLAVTVDIEDWYHIPSVTGSPFSQYRDTAEFFSRWEGRFDYLSEPTRRVLGLLEEFGITATFFVVGEVVERYPGLVEEIAGHGHEIACHGLHHACKIDPRTRKPLLTPGEFRTGTTEARRVLEQASGQNVVGYRAPSALIGGWMRDVLEDLGFLYDSSVSRNSLYNKTDGDLGGVTSAPYAPVPRGLGPGGGPRFLEFPWATLDLPGLRLPASGGPFLRFLGARLILRGLRQSLARGPAVFYFHPLDISRETFPAAGKGRPLYWMIKGKVVEDRIRYLLEKLGHVPVKPLRDIAMEMSHGG
jgi:peptidoglycan/xylan/chitin deacetylase (PgdA/CDA1 family)